MPLSQAARLSINLMQFLFHEFGCKSSIVHYIGTYWFIGKVHQYAKCFQLMFEYLASQESTSLPSLRDTFQFHSLSIFV